MNFVVATTKFEIGKVQRAVIKGTLCLNHTLYIAAS
jgi:hypothetical protein